MSWKRILDGLLLAFACSVVAVRHVAAQDAEVMWTRVIASEPGRQCAWPSVAKAADGSIVVVFSGDREAHICPWGKVQMVRSKDGGETWTQPRTIGKTKLDDRDPGIVMLPDGRLFVTWFNSVAYRTHFDLDTTNYPPGSAKAKWQEFDRSMSEAEKRENCGFYGIWSADNGETWTPPEKLVSLRSQTPHGPIVLKNGALLQFGRRFDDNLKRMFTPKYWEHTTITVERSADGGHLWKTLCDGISDSTGENDRHKHWFHEPHVAELPNGELYALIRADYAKDVLMRQTRSTDGGRTWEPITETELSGFPPHLLVLKDERLLAVYGRRTKERGGFGEYASVSSDGGRTWDFEVKLSGATNNDLGYPASVEVSPNVVLTVYYQQPPTGGKPCIMATKWSVKSLKSRPLPSTQRTGIKSDLVAEVAVHSVAMKKEVLTTVIVPNGYADSGDRRYPVVYLLHGSGNDQWTYAREPILSLADRIGAIIVCPYGDASWWIDSPRMPWMRYETFVTKELVPYVDGRYRTVAGKRGRAIAGHSMGGHGACFIGFGHTDLFGAVGNVMGGVDLRPFSTRPDLRKLLGDPAEHPDDWERFSAISRAATLRNGEVQLTTVVGTGDFFFGVNRAMHELLSSNRVAHVHQEIRGIDEEHSTHTRTFAYEAMKTVFARFGEYFKSERKQGE